MFTRHVIMELKPNATTEFTNVVESKILPLLRKQKGFRDSGDARIRCSTPLHECERRATSER